MEDNYEFSEFVKIKKRLNSKTKGSSFERKVCKLLNNHFETNEFNRSPNSGAYATTHNLPEYLKIYGDIITPENFKYSLEIKKGYSDINISDLFNKKSKFWGFIEQANRDGRKSKKPYLIIWQQDRGRILCVLPKTYDLFLENHLTFGIINIITLENLLRLNDKTKFYNF